MASPFLAGLLQALSKQISPAIMQGFNQGHTQVLLDRLTQPQSVENQTPFGTAMQSQRPEQRPDYLNNILSLFQQNPELAKQFTSMTTPKYQILNQENGGYQVFGQTGNEPPKVISQQPPFAKPVPLLLRSEPKAINGVTKMLDTYGYNQGGKEVITERKYSDFTPPQSGGNALDKSYQFHTAQISALSKPIQDRRDRIERLQTSLNEKTPQADALIAPELLTAMAGGQGSGLRMNEAEISRIVGGRTALEGLKSTMMRYINEPNKPFLIPDNQRAQIQSLLNAVEQQAQENQNAVIEAQQRLSEAKDTQTHKKIFSNLRSRLLGGTQQTGKPNIGDIKTFPNGKKGKWDGTGWEQIP